MQDHVDTDGHETFEYSASSPDELALVNAARYFGYKFIGWDENQYMEVEVTNIFIPKPSKPQILKFELLNIIEFTSTRKRMSAIIWMPDGKIKLLCKGADSVII